ncbi:MAG: hypothetical protein AVDCRST_MAG59-3356, partial [uncultured Thermomicrobiales bacterium]
GRHCPAAPTRGGRRLRQWRAPCHPGSARIPAGSGSPSPTSRGQPMSRAGGALPPRLPQSSPL